MLSAKVLFLVVASALSKPLPSPKALESRAATPSNYAGDAPYSVAEATLKAAVACPNGIRGAAGGIVFLVHGTGSTGSESWKNGPYNKLLPTAGRGYDICWVDLPNRSLVDAQLSAEYVSYGIRYLAPQSKTGQVSIIGHSQGAGFNPQWSLTFWPSGASKVTTYVALAPDFKGTISGLLLCGLGQNCAPSVWQQSTGSNYLAAQNSPNPGSGATARVPTTSLFTLTDDVIQPEFPRAIATSNLAGAKVLALQDLNVCGPLQVADHFLMIVNPAAYALALDALENKGVADPSRLNKAYCFGFVDNVLFSPSDAAAFLRSSFTELAYTLVGEMAPAEPTLQPYVCERGFATSCGPAF